MLRVMVRQLLDEKSFQEQRKITQKDLCEETGLSKNTVSRLFSMPGYNGSFDSIDVLCKYFSCQPGDILRYIDQEDMPEKNSKK